MATISSVVKFFPTAKESFSTTLASTISSGATTVPLNSVSGYTNGDTVVLVVDPADSTKKQVFTGVVDTSGVQLTSVVWTEGTNQSHSGGATVVDYVTATHMSMVTAGILVGHNQTGLHKAFTESNIVPTAAIQNSAVTNAKLATDISPVNFSNPYKFRAHPTADYSAGNGVKVQLGTEDFDTGNNFDNVTNYRFTAPIAGFYQFNATVSQTSNAGGGTSYAVEIWKNGVRFLTSQEVDTYASSFSHTYSVSTLEKVAAGDYFELFSIGAATNTVSAALTAFSGFLVSVL